MSSLGTILVVAFGGLLAWRGEMNVEDIVAFLLYLSLFYAPITGLANLLAAQGVDTDDRTIALEMGLPYLVSRDAGGSFAAGLILFCMHLSAQPIRSSTVFSVPDACGGIRAPARVLPFSFSSLTPCWTPWGFLTWMWYTAPRKRRVTV